MEKINKEFGKHYIVELIGCDVEKIKVIKDVKKAFLHAARKSKATILKHFFHQFKPYGVTGIILIAWSHFAVHTWPEDNYVSLDILTCGEEMCPEIAINELKNSFNAKKTKVKILARGF